MQSGHAWGFFLLKLCLAETCCESDPSFDAGRQRGSENAQAECRLEGGFNCPLSDNTTDHIYQEAKTGLGEECMQIACTHVHSAGSGAGA